MKNPFPFPEGFYWGASLSAHQTEGNNHNDWSEWEKSYALTKPDPENYISGIATDHYHRYSEDFALAKELHFTACRISIEWSRIEPEEGQFNEDELAHYRQVITTMRQNNLEPFITLWHWTIPLWIRDQGGWQSAATEDYFVRFVKRVVEYLGDEVKFWAILNEPEVYTSNAFVLGRRPPQKRQWWLYPIILRRLIKTHRQCYSLIKQFNPEAQIGVAKDCYHFEVVGNSLIDRFIAFFADWGRNRYFFNQISEYQDFLGINYYVHFQVQNRKLIDTGWQGAAAGLLPLLQKLSHYQKPLIITENGTIDATDDHRQVYIESILTSLAKALDSGCPVKGYLHWALTDNFEWEAGFALRFGLINIDYQHEVTRQPRPSASYYATICKNNTLPLPE